MQHQSQGQGDEPIFTIGFGLEEFRGLYPQQHPARARTGCPLDAAHVHRDLPSIRLEPLAQPNNRS
jgi:hypothetical protein